MEITIVERPGSEATIVALRDELDMSSAPRLHAILGDMLGRSVNRIVVDLSGLTFCDSMGLSALAVTHNACVAAGGYLRIADPSPFLLRILTAFGLRGRFPIYTSAQAACAGDPAGLLDDPARFGDRAGLGDPAGSRKAMENDVSQPAVDHIRDHVGRRRLPPPVGG